MMLIKIYEISYDQMREVPILKTEIIHYRVCYRCTQIVCIFINGFGGVIRPKTAFLPAHRNVHK